MDDDVRVPKSLAERTEAMFRSVDPQGILALEWKVALAAPSPTAPAEGRPIATILSNDPYDERDGPWFAQADLEKLRKLPAGTKLYTHPAPPLPEGNTVPCVVVPSIETMKRDELLKRLGEIGYQRDRILERLNERNGE